MTTIPASSSRGRVSKIRIQYFQGAVTKYWYFHIVARNSRIICQSEGYVKKAACLKTINLIKHDDWIVEQT